MDPHASMGGAPAVNASGRLGSARLATLAARASTLLERIDGEVELVPGDPAVVEQRLERWSEMVARGDPEQFEARLSLDGLDVDAARRLLGEARFREGDPIPDWALFLDEGLSLAVRDDLDEDRSLPRAGEDVVPLQELTVAFVRAARQRVERQVARASERVSASAFAMLERRLLRQLGGLLAPVADLEFRLWRRSFVDPFGEAMHRASEEPGRGLYDDWVEMLRSGGLANCLMEYPVLGRQIGLLALGWVDATVEFLERLLDDGPPLGQAFNGGRPVGQLVSVGGADSDPHRGRRCVVGCRFESGLRLVYKPKDLRTEVAYSSLLAWLNERGADPPLRPLQVVDRGSYGWVEYAEHEGVDDADAARRFYRRAGSLLALMHAIGGKDCYTDNVVAAGEQPIIVDAETVLHPLLRAPDTPADGDRNALQTATERVGSSVLSVGILPSWTVAPNGRAIDVSALGAVGVQDAPEPMPVWEKPNTDVARLVLRTSQVGPYLSELHVDGVPQQPEDHVDDLCAGFQDTYRLLRRHRDELVDGGGPLAGLESAPVRVVLRPTRLYSRVAVSASAPEHLRSGVDYSIRIEALGRPLLDGPEPTAFWEIYRLEHRQLSVTDTPYFSAAGSAPALSADDGRPLVAFEASALETAKRRLLSLDDEDERFQLSLIRAALSTMGALPSIAIPEADGAGNGIAPLAVDGRATDAAARLLAEELAASAIRTRGSLAWVGLSLGDQVERWVLQPSMFDLYEGATGIAIFLAALARADGEERWKELALGALCPLLDAVGQNPGLLAQVRGIGLATGSGGMVYALALLSELLDDDRVLECARALGRSIPGRAIERDRTFDLMGGSAGLIIGLLALDRVAGGDRPAVDAARLAGERLVRSAARFEDGSPGWLTISARALDGASHGSAGIVLALARLAVRTGDERLVEVVEATVLGESGRYDETLGGWRDRRSEEAEQIAVLSWCHGAAGIGLTRLELLELPLAGSIHDVARVDVARAADAVRKGHRGGMADHLCCGGAGETEFLLQLAATTGDEPARELAESRCDALARKLLAGEPPQLNRPDSPGAREVPAPGLFQGIAGIGLSLLRGASPDLPSVLSWR